MKTLIIATACFLNENRELLIVRKKNTRMWMLPGGKLAHQESSSDALIREIREELQITLVADDLAHLGSFKAVAANETDTAVHADVFVASLPSKQKPRVSAEIVEMRWLSLNAQLPSTIAPLLKEHIIPVLLAL